MKNPQRTTRAIHRWLGLVTGVQLLFWCAGGFVFSTHEIEWVRGNHGRDNSPPATLPADGIATSPAKAIAARGLAAVHEVTLTTLLGKPVYRLARQGGTALVDAASGEAFTIDEAQARAIARTDRGEQPEVSRVTLITGHAPVEFRGRDDFNTPWLIGFSVLGLLSVCSGWAIWLFRLVRRPGRAAA